MHYYCIELLRCIAAILITNSHYNNIWPIGALATGGSLGNTLFFAISGFCLSDTKKTNFLIWIRKRLLRIYPPVVIITFVEFVIVDNKIKSVADFIRYFIYPTQFWFASAIILFYVLFYFITRYADNYINKIIGFMLIVYMFAYITVLDINHWSIEGTSYFKWIYYFIIMLLGYKLKTYKISTFKRIFEIKLLLSVVLYFGFKLILDVFPRLLCIQFCSHIISGWFMIEAFRVGFMYENKIKEFSKSKCYKVISFISSLTFEIYLVQTFVIRRFEMLRFPINFIVVTIMICIEAFLLSKVTQCSKNLRIKKWR